MSLSLQPLMSSRHNVPSFGARLVQLTVNNQKVKEPERLAQLEILFNTQMGPEGPKLVALSRTTQPHAPDTMLLLTKEEAARLYVNPIAPATGITLTPGTMLAPSPRDVGETESQLRRLIYEGHAAQEPYVQLYFTSDDLVNLSQAQLVTPLESIGMNPYRPMVAHYPWTIAETKPA